MFGKDYDKEIEAIYKVIDKIIKTQNENQDKLLEQIKGNMDLITGINKNLIEIAKVQKTHKEAIMLLKDR